MAERVKIGKQLEKSINPWSTLITGDNNEGMYLPPGDSGQVLTMSSGIINWADPALEINGTPGYLARFDGLGTNIEDSKIFDNSPNAAFTDVRILDDTTNNTYIQFVSRNDSDSILSFVDTPGVFTVADDGGINYMYDYCTPTVRYYGQKIGLHQFRDSSGVPLVNIGTTGSLGFSVSCVPDTYVSASFKATSNCAGISSATIPNTGTNNYVHRSEGLINSFGDIQISNHTIPDYEDTEGSDFLRFSSFTTSFVNSTTTPFAFVVGQSYKIVNYVAGDNFTNIANVQVGVTNTTGCIFIATGTTPTTWTNSSEIGYDFAEVDNNQFILNNTGTDVVFDTTVGEGPITSYEFRFNGVTATQIFEEGIATLSGSIWDFGAAAGGAPGAANTTITVTIDGVSYAIHATV